MFMQESTSPQDGSLIPDANLKLTILLLLFFISHFSKGSELEKDRSEWIATSDKVVALCLLV